MTPRILYRLVTVIFLVSCSRHYIRQKQDFHHYAIKEESAESGPVKATVAVYKTKVTSETEKVIAVSAAVFTRNKAQSTLGNFVCDALKHSADSLFRDTPPDLIIVNRGGLRIDLPQGEIKVATIFELMPFENELVLASVTGEKLWQFIPLFEQKKHAYWGAKITLKHDTVIRFLVGDRPVENSKTYRILTSDFLVHGGDNFDFLSQPVARQNTGLKIRDAIIAYCRYQTQQHKILTPYTDERLELSN